MEVRVFLRVLSVAELLLEGDDLILELLVALFYDLGIQYSSHAFPSAAYLLERLAEFFGVVIYFVWVLHQCDHVEAFLDFSVDASYCLTLIFCD